MNRKTAIPLSFILCAATTTSIATAFVDPAATSSAAVASASSSSWRRRQHHRQQQQSRPSSYSPLRMTEDDDENNPLSRGIDSVSWLPSVFDTSPSSRSVFDAAMSSGSDEEEGEIETLPLFPLGGIVYTPNSEHILNIFEPRYRQMYNDILMNGSKRFVVSMCHPNEEGRFAQMGVLFSLEELKEVSEMTADRVKYICNHRVTGRVKLHGVVNPEAWESRDTYLKVRGSVIDDTAGTTVIPSEEYDENDEDVKAAKRMVAAAVAADETPEERALSLSFSDLVELQHDLSEDVRFTRASTRSFGVAEGTEVDPNLWTSIRLWQSYAEQRLVARQNEMQKEFQERLVEYLKKDMGKKSGSKGDGEDDEELPSAIGFEDLSPELQSELVDLQKRMTTELKPLLLEQTLSMQKILEAADHDERVELMRYFVDAERRRLQAKKTLKSMFGGNPSAVTTRESDGIEASKEGEEEKKEAESQFFAEDEGDAFQ